MPIIHNPDLNVVKILKIFTGNNIDHDGLYFILHVNKFLKIKKPNNTIRHRLLVASYYLEERNEFHCSSFLFFFSFVYRSIQRIILNERSVNIGYQGKKR